MEASVQENVIESNQGPETGKGPLNILIVVPWHPPDPGGGVSINVKKVSWMLTRMGHKVSILTNGESTKVAKVRDDDGVPVYELQARSFFSKRRPLRALVSCLVYLPPTLAELRRFLRQNQIDIVAIFYPEIHNFYYVLAKYLFGTRYVLCVQGSDIRVDINEHRVIKKAVASLLRHADGLVTVSKILMDEARDIFARLPGRSRVVHNGIELGWGQQDTGGTYFHARSYILSLAAPIPVKGPDILLKAFALIKDSYPEVDLLMAGTGREEEWVRGLIGELGLSGRVIRTGHIAHSKLPSLYKSALFGVMPSRNEGFPFASLEFQAMKKAVVASSVGGLPESITDGYNGLLVPPENPQALAEKMSYLLDHPELCQKMGENGYKRVRERFSLERTGAEFERLFREILSGT